jgi:tetratricopeptide (TPR) repeat protein
LSGYRVSLVLALAFAALALLTVWNLVRSDALVEARRAYARGDLAPSLGYALDHLKRQPWSREAALLAARCLSRLDYADQAEPYYRRAGNLSLNDLQVRAYALLRGPHLERAIPAYEEILTRSPQNVGALRRLAALQLARNDTDELLRLADRMDQIPGAAVLGATLRGVFHHNQQNRQAAAVAFERVLKLDPDLREMPLSLHLFWDELSRDLMGSGRIDDARRYLLEAIRKTNDAELINRLAHTYLLQGDIESAEAWFRKAAECDPSDYVPHLNLAKIALQRHNQEDALRRLDRARVLAPRERGVLYNLSSVYRQLGRNEEARRVQEAIDQTREAGALSSQRAHGTWPRYAL